jgi:signal transduction histidine kinase
MPETPRVGVLGDGAHLPILIRVSRFIGVPVGRRLSLLVVAEVAAAAVLLTLGIISLEQLASESSFMHRFVLVPVEDIETSLDDTSILALAGDNPAMAPGLVQRVGDFAERYRSQIQLSGSTTADANRQRGQLERAGRLELVDREKHTVDKMLEEVRELKNEVRSHSSLNLEVVANLRATLRALLRINFEFVNIAQAEISNRARTERIILISVGLAGIVLAAFLGLQVRQAIAPRIQNLVLKVKRFQEFGINERTPNARGDDEIAVLSNALDSGFAAIAERSRERERFLAIAAHELKTPMVSILGFVQVALTNSEQRVRALEIIGRQTSRLGHLVEDLLWAASARSGQLPFHPVPLDLADLVRRLAGEVSAAVPSHTIHVEGPASAHILADESLAAHALWSLLTYATVASARDQAIEVRLACQPTCVLTVIEVRGPPLATEDLIRLFEPFSTVQYETDARPRVALGLYLCREIARIHGGSVLIEMPGTGPVITLELPS